MDQAAYSEGLRRLLAFFALENLIDRLSSAGIPRDLARHRIELDAWSGPAELLWFDLRWPEQ